MFYRSKNTSRIALKKAQKALDRTIGWKHASGLIAVNGIVLIISIIVWWHHSTEPRANIFQIHQTELWKNPPSSMQSRSMWTDTFTLAHQFVIYMNDQENMGKGDYVMEQFAPFRREFVRETEKTSSRFVLEDIEQIEHTWDPKTGDYMRLMLVILDAKDSVRATGEVEIERGYGEVEVLDGPLHSSGRYERGPRIHIAVCISSMDLLDLYLGRIVESLNSQWEEGDTNFRMLLLAPPHWSSQDETKVNLCMRTSVFEYAVGQLSRDSVDMCREIAVDSAEEEDIVMVVNGADIILPWDALIRVRRGCIRDQRAYTPAVFTIAEGHKIRDYYRHGSTQFHVQGAYSESLDVVAAFVSDWRRTGLVRRGLRPDGKLTRKCPVKTIHGATMHVWMQRTEEVGYFRGAIGIREELEGGKVW